MKKHLPLTGLAATLCLLLSGCAPLERIDKIDNTVSQNEKQADKHLHAIKNGAVVRDLTSQWINPYPLNAQSGSNSLLPPCAVAINRPGSITLAEVSAFISKRCRLPVVVTPDAQAILAPTGGGKTEQLSGPIPAPDPNGMVALAALGGTPTRTAPAVSGGSALRGLFWQGELGGLLDNVTTRLGLSWRYEQGRIAIFYLDTRTFPVMFMDSKASFGSKTVSGTTSSMGATGDSSGGGLSGDSNTSQATEMEIKSSLYEDVTNTIKSMLTPGTGRMNLSAGVLTVTDTPRVLEQIGRYLDDRNNELNRQVVLNVQVYSVEKRTQDQYGIDWNAVFNSGSVGLSLTNAFTGAASDALNGGVSILDGKGAGTKAFIKALSEQANVSVMTEASSMTTNLSAVPIQVALQQDYASNVTTENTANVGSSSSITKSTITTGFNMTVLPFLMPQSPKMQLQFAINMSDDPTMRTFTSDNTSVELMKTRLKTFTQRVIMQSGQTLVLSGYQSLNNTANRQGVGTFRFFGLGGGANGENNKTMLVILITPVILG
ncbi:PilN family type IVB pilus formation outer membrane protein [Serratia marcescens]|jgi:type IVB pilus formation R64 PilN family outer membrane protein|uniref:PilN family type IVB pilus formation outer membrane protein n=1 Tax=Serratia liquefaciens TaxID=614 RepID=A0ABX7DBW3_SERLI|nr:MULTISPECIES: PilN family type IVB pilus formation outer membrane protein [Serratia]MBH3245111.1 PilN family type IVB pilus formation outer membrane protein [Serratia marcescens]MBN5413916.1 PilN family type IVB pilus formation outer membrane protein [Serratia marcescens]MDP8737011.1 PilN family type IVB pilus formation outer membrane protein [Serratia marcescens]MDU4176736.1 PilN family type IVB pilus formation outer membrane protein [Serratia liquefaciens]QDI35762.1 PilN family type IVB p